VARRSPLDRFYDESALEGCTQALCRQCFAPWRQLCDGLLRAVGEATKQRCTPFTIEE